jgi:hypothetical protein
MAIGLVLLGGVVVAAVAAIWGGFVLSIMWGWFVVGLFGLPALSIPQAIGISLVVAMLAHQRPPERTDDDDWLTSIAYSVIAPLLTLCVGWVVKAFL